ncbi:MAG: protein-disulfide reductase DsbD family protein, partial [Hyphomicrobiales bacterium]
RSLPGFGQILMFAAFAFFGGLILNVMPCVLPVLSIKLASVLSHSDRPTHIVRGGFLMSALGVLTFMWALAAGILILQASGITVGWGLQFQSPVFLTIMFMILAVFATNLFGIFEISLPSKLQSRLANSGGREGYLGDFATGAFAAVLATPCSAPFLGTAIAFALTGRSIDVVIIFTMLGIGLALPYLVFAARPEWIRYLPKPGRWMVIIKWVLGFLLALTAVWLLWVLSGVAGTWVAVAVLGLSLGFVLLTVVPKLGTYTRMVSLAATSIVAILTAINFAAVLSVQAVSENWVAFDRGEIPRLVSQGNTVFVDVTADWCLTCKANKALVLDREPVAQLLMSNHVIKMQADWTRPDPKIARYLEANNRFGIPFNIIYGPNAPNGILLSEVLSSEKIKTALEEARKPN